ncbi:hypothetical protein [Streptomyces variegatus]|uniref:hypothetical protein n=1 Tax=Streptomyces variegatus TaxID=284040 RepID=UPI003C2FEB12
MGFGSGQTCWRRVERWQQAGVFDPSCTGSCSPSSTRRGSSIGPGRAWTAPTSARKKRGAPAPVRRRSTAGRRAANTP